jgi:hypothetical protein
MNDDARCDVPISSSTDAPDDMNRCALFARAARRDAVRAMAEAVARNIDGASRCDAETEEKKNEGARARENINKYIYIHVRTRSSCATRWANSKRLL